MNAPPSMPDLRASHFEYLAAVLEHPTWRQAAEAVGVTPSALSQGIAQLEGRLNITLFDRQGRRRVPTPEAAVANSFGTRVLAELQGLGRWASDVRSGTVGTIAVGMIDTAAIHHFGDVLVELRRDNPELKLRLTVEPSNRLLARLRAGELDAAVAVNPDPHDDLTITPLLSEPLYAYARSAPDPIPKSQWGPWVGFPATSRTRAQIARALRRRGVAYDVIAESSQPAVLREMVQLDMGWCVLCETDAESEPHALKRAHPEPIATRTLALCRRVDRTPGPALENLLMRLTAAPRTGPRSFQP